MGIDEDPRATAEKKYGQRHPGRVPFDDAIAGLVMAAPSAIDVWFDSFIAEAARMAMKGRQPEAFPPLEPWVRGVLTMRLIWLRACEIKPEPGSKLNWLADPAVLHQLIQVPPLPLLSGILDADQQMVSELAGDGGHKSFAEIAAELRDRTFSLLADDKRRDAMEYEGRVDDMMTGELLDLARDMTAGLADCAPKGRKARRPEDQVLRGFYTGVCWLYNRDGLGEPSVDDLTVLALAGGFDRASYQTVRDRWRKRAKALATEVST